VPPCPNGACHGTSNTSANPGGRSGGGGHRGRGGRNNRGRGRNGRGGGKGGDGNSFHDSTPQPPQGPWVCFNPFAQVPPTWRGAPAGGAGLLGPAPLAYQSAYVTSFAPLQMHVASPPVSP
jgi:hypothetical protein